MDLVLSPQVYARTAIRSSSLAVMKTFVALDGLRTRGEVEVSASPRALAAMTGLGQPAIRKALASLPSLSVEMDGREIAPVESHDGESVRFAGPWAAWTAQGREDMPLGEFADLKTRCGLMLWLRAPVGRHGPHRIVADEAALLVGDPGKDGPTAVHRKLVLAGVADFNAASRGLQVEVEPRLTTNKYLRWWSIRYLATGAMSGPPEDDTQASLPLTANPPSALHTPPRLLEPLPPKGLPLAERQALIMDQKSRGVFDRAAHQREVADAEEFLATDLGDVPDD